MSEKFRSGPAPRGDVRAWAAIQRRRQPRLGTGGYCRSGGRLLPNCFGTHFFLSGMRAARRGRQRNQQLGAGSRPQPGPQTCGIDLQGPSGIHSHVEKSGPLAHGPFRRWRSRAKRRQSQERLGRRTAGKSEGAGRTHGLVEWFGTHFFRVPLELRFRGKAWEEPSVGPLDTETGGGAEINRLSKGERSHSRGHSAPQGRTNRRGGGGGIYSILHSWGGAKELRPTDNSCWSLSDQTPRCHRIDGLVFA